MKSAPCDLFILAAEPSADLHGSKLVENLLKLRPNLNIAAVAGPKMRALPIQTLFPMEKLQVMGFIDVVAALPRIAKYFFTLRNKILTLNPKAIVCIDYPGFNLRLEASLRKKGYQGKLIHYICPTVWAWGKKRIPKMAKTLDLLLTFFPFEKNCFASTSLQVESIGHPLVTQIPPPLFNQEKKEPILALFPGSREKEILRNFPIQIQAAQKLTTLDSSLQIAVSVANPQYEPFFHSLAKGTNIHFVPSHATYQLMQKARAAIATSGTVTLELALHSVPTVVNYAIRPLDLFLAQKIFHINLPFYSLPNIILSRELFPEFFGPNLSLENVEQAVRSLWFDQGVRSKISAGCGELRARIGAQDASQAAAQAVITVAF